MRWLSLFVHPDCDRHTLCSLVRLGLNGVVWTEMHGTIDALTEEGVVLVDFHAGEERPETGFAVIPKAIPVESVNRALIERWTRLLEQQEGAGVMIGMKGRWTVTGARCDDEGFIRDPTLGPQAEKPARPPLRHQAVRDGECRLCGGPVHAGDPYWRSKLACQDCYERSEA